MPEFASHSEPAPAILPMCPAAHREPVGLLAGWGRFPVVFAATAERLGYPVHGLGIEGMADPELARFCTSYNTAPLARIGKAIRHFRRRGITSAVMAGKVEKRVLFDPFRFWRLLPDWRTVHMWLKYCTENKKDDTILLAVIREFARDGIHFRSALDFCPELLVQHGFLTRRQPTASQWKDIRFGWEIAKEMGRLDIGQTIVVNDTAIIAVEAIEGTDECIRRAGTLCRRGGMSVIKVAKPQQDMRFDVPTVGLQTIQTMRESGARVLAIEAGLTILLDEAEVVALADKLGICIVSIKAEELRLRSAA